MPCRLLRAANLEGPHNDNRDFGPSLFQTTAEL